jgi:triosephosphate isomerase
VERKVQACLRWSIKPIVCIGEQKRIFDGRGDVDTYEWDKLANQLLTAVQSLSAEQLSHVIIAYEPVWAIGSRNPASAEYTMQVIEKLKERLNKEAIKGASELQFLYGGSVSAENAANLLRHRDIDGLLVGSASVKAKEFIAITELAAQMR